MAESNGLLNRRTVNRLYRGFESRPLRSSQNTDDSQCQQGLQALQSQGDAAPGIGSSNLPTEPMLVPPDDQTDTTGGHRAAKLDHIDLGIA